MIKEKLLLHVYEFLKIQDALTKSKIDAVYLKGFLQHFNLTKRWPNKAPVDIDILIPSLSFNRVKNILISLDFSQHRKYRNPQSRPQINFVKETSVGPVVCDVHNQTFFPTKYIFNVLPPKLVKQITAEFISRTTTISFQNQKFRILKPEDMLLHQCLNFFFHHSLKNPRQSFDISTIAKYQKINWHYVVKKLTDWKLKEFAYFSLLVSKRLAKAKIPDFVLKKLKSKNALPFLNLILTNPKIASKPIKNMHSRFRYNILLRFLIFDKPMTEKIKTVLRYFLPKILPKKNSPVE